MIAHPTGMNQLKTRHKYKQMHISLLSAAIKTATSLKRPIVSLYLGCPIRVLAERTLNLSGCPLFPRSIQQNLDYYPKLSHDSSLPLFELIFTAHYLSLKPQLMA